jgi:DNA-binding response OmpR family regulator/AraC-like DNA-binding protein
MTGPASAPAASAAYVPVVRVPDSASPRRPRPAADRSRRERDREFGTSTVGSASRQRLLWVEDEPKLMAPITAYLTEQGFDIQFATSGETGLRMAASGTYAAILLDLKLPDIDGIEMLQRLRSAGIGTPVIVITGLDLIESAGRAVRYGAADIKAKPLRGADLLQTIRSVLAYVSRERPPARLFREPVGEGSSPSVGRIIGQLTRITDVTETRDIKSWPETGSALRKDLARAAADPQLTLVEFSAVADGLRLLSSDERPWPRLALQHTLDRIDAASRCDWRRADERARRFVIKLIAAGKACLQLSEKAVAKELGVHRDALSTVIRREFRLSIPQLRRLIVMRRAVQMLAVTDEQVAQIAYAVGYEHPSAFNHSFASLFGVSPRKYRGLIGAETQNERPPLPRDQD